ncbi:TonB-dependent receptor [Parapedobacter koreensis]|uniref:TonB-dependent Receptor Plug Domain n=1 Tax=Parapedobacter koreensis TaxID=332977 RepID=A0A1H7L8I3_9SPHI|nr:TonB-dependent receptor [Parapedobacter koreensis]SEK95279.1 TonB-dependent Receptor Plug Domain [Parapedobacter koreensis]
MNRRFYILLNAIVCLPFFLFADEVGRVTGKVLDEGSNSPLAGVSVQVIGASEATSTDFEGDYTLGLEAGTYTLRFSSVGYAVKEISEVKIEGGKAVEIDVTLVPSADELEEVVVTVSARRNTEISLLNMQRNAGVVMDGLSSQSIQRSGASTIATAVRTVPGVSVQDGKYVYVRGLGDRYSKSILNGMDIPGLDPDKNTVQMDIFPTNILENIVVVKSGSAELPADFTGGVVDIVTKDIPSQKQIGISASVGYNPDMHLNNNYVGYKGSSTDFLGFDNGDRKLPISPTLDIPTPAQAQGREALEGITRSFNPVMGAERENSMPDLSLGFDFSNQYKLWGNQLGVIAALNYKNTTTFYEGFQNGIYRRPIQTDPDPALRPDRTQIGDLGGRNVLLSGMVGLNYKTGMSKYSLNLLHIQNGESRAAIYDQVTRIANIIDVFKQTLDYSQRSVSNILFSGKHSNEDATFLTEWKVSPSLARVQDKDVRTTTFVEEGSRYTIRTDAGIPTRIWRDLEEINAVGKVDFTKKMSLFNRDAALKFGGLYSYKQRDYSIYNYSIDSRAVDHSELNGDPNAILLPENVWTSGTNTGYYIRGNYQASNTFDASQHTGSLYVSGEFRPWEKLRTIVGVRAEQYTTFFTGVNIDRLEYDNERTINKLDFFPSINLIYNVVENHNLRASYARTTARPSFKELSVVQIFDPLTDTRFLGNLELVPTYIDNIDLRYELFGDQSQMFAVSGFYKYFRNPIELQVYSDSAPNNFTPRNAPYANVYGVEAEARKNFGFISESLTNLSLNVNVSVVNSIIEMGEDEYESRQFFAREGEEIDDTRQLQGQSPYLINAGLNYNNLDMGFEAGLFYNVQGKTLEVIGFSRNADVYAKPFNSLNFNLTKKMGVNKRGALNIKVENILDAERRSVYEAYQATDQIYQLRAPGRNFSIGYSYTF